MNRLVFLLIPLLATVAGAQINEVQISDMRTSDDIADPDYSYAPDPVAAKPKDAGVTLLTRPIPHPYLALAGALMGGGYAPLGYRAEGGIDMESTHAIVRALAAYDNGHKIDDNDQPNPNGHDRYLEGAAYYRLRGTLLGHSLAGWFVGAGWRWNQLSTTNYTKGGTRPEFGGGYDLSLHPCDGCRRDFSMRINLDWVTAGTDWQNGLHGPEMQFSFPAPSEKRHWFFRERLGVYRFYTTVTDPHNLELTRWQRDHRSFTSDADFAVLYRF
jgi:hypothetical protein